MAQLVEARELVQQLQFGPAIELLSSTSLRSDVSPAELNAIRELLAYCQVAEGRKEDAETTYRALLEDAPATELSRESSSPKVLEIFRATKAKMYPKDYVRIQELPASAGLVKLVLIDPWSQIHTVTLFERHNHGTWLARDLDTDSQLSFSLQPRAGGQVEWYVEARSEAKIVARVGSAEAPHIISVPQLEVVPQPDSSAPKLRRGAGLVTLGLGVVAAAVAAGLHIGGWNLRQAARDASRPPGDSAETARAAEVQGQQLQVWGTGCIVGAGLVTTAGVVLVW